MGYIKKLKNNELVGGTDKHTIYPVTSTKAVFEEVTEGDKSSFKSQETINGDYDDRIKGLETVMPDTIKSITINGGTKTYLPEDGNVELTIYSEGGEDYPAISELVEQNAANIENIQNEIGTDTTQNTLSGRITELETLVGGSGQGSVNTRIANTKAEILGDAAEDYNTLGKVEDKIQEEVARATAEETELSLYVHNIEGGNIRVKTSVPTNPDTGAPANTVYRVAGTNTYSDYMWNGITMVKMAEYNVDTLESQFGYYKWETASNTISITTNNQVADSPIGSYLLTYGGSFKIKMSNKATGACTLNMNGKGAKTLLYNGDPIDSNNTWEINETISVYYDGTVYQASNSQGGSNRKIDAYLYGDLRTLAVGQTYNVDEAVKTTDKQLRRITKEITPLSLSETLTSGSLKESGNATYRAARTISIYNPNPSTPYSAGAYALGIMTVYTLTVTAESVTAGSITVNETEVAVEATDDASAIASNIANALVIEGWTTSVAENVVTVRCNIIGNNTTTITIDVGDTGVVVSGNSTPSVAGTDVIMKYDGESWTEAEVNTMATDGVLVEVDEAWLIANATAQNSIVKDVSLDKELYSIPYLNTFSGDNSRLTTSKTSSTISINVQRQDTSAKAIAGFIIPPYIAGKKIGLKFNFSKTSGDNTNTPLYFFGAASTYTRLGVICTLSDNNGFVDEIVDVPENTAYIGIIANGINRYSTLTLSDLVIYERDEQKTLAQKTEDNSDILNNLLGTNYFDLEKAIIYGSDATKGTIEKIDNGIKVTCVTYSNQLLWWLFPNNLKMGTEYIISFDATIKGGSLNGAVAHNMDIYNNDGTFIANFIISKNGHYEKRLKINGSLYRFRINSGALIGRAGVSVEFTNISFKVPSVNINKIEDIAEEVSVLDSRLVACESSCKDKDTHFFDVEEDGLYFVDKYLNIGGKFDSNGFHAININE